MQRFNIAGSLLFIGGMIVLVSPAFGADAKVTFERDVRPILAKHCQACHSPGKVAPMSFVTYLETKPWVGKIKEIIQSKTMPPSVGAAHLSVLTQSEGPTNKEKKTLVAWVDAGAPEGAPVKNQNGDKRK